MVEANFVEDDDKIPELINDYEIIYHRYGAGGNQIECIVRNKDGLAFDEYGQVKSCGACGGALKYTAIFREYKCTKCGEVY